MYLHYFRSCIKDLRSWVCFLACLSDNYEIETHDKIISNASHGTQSMEQQSISDQFSCVPVLMRSSNQADEKLLRARKTLCISPDLEPLSAHWTQEASKIVFCTVIFEDHLLRCWLFAQYRSLEDIFIVQHPFRPCFKLNACCDLKRAVWCDGINLR